VDLIAVELIISSDPRWLRMVRVMMQEFARQAGFGERERREITIAVDEALANVIKHSYKGDHKGAVSLTCAVADGHLEVVLKDQGEAFDQQGFRLQPPDALRAGGRGTFLIHSTMDEVEYRRAGDTNVLRLRKYMKERAG
jgi:serine/threonine-protein kinase RsbW